MSEKNKILVDQFLHKYNNHSDDLDFLSTCQNMINEMKHGLNEEPSSLLMIPTYLKDDNNIPDNSKAIALDAGGTNLRIALVNFINGEVVIEKLMKTKMLGVEKPLEKEEFIEKIADMLIPYLAYCHNVGFCFSFAAEITPQKDGKVISMCKEVQINNIKDTLICAEIKQALKRKGIKDEIHFVLLNDTVATVLGCYDKQSNQLYDSSIGFILGTGTNIAYSEKISNIKKLGIKSNDTMIINTESGMFDKIQRGLFERMVDENTILPNYEVLEKMVSGAYIGKIVYYCLKKACEDELFSNSNLFNELTSLTTIDVDDFLRNKDTFLKKFLKEEKDINIARLLIEGIIDRCAKVNAISLSAIILANDSGKNKPVRIIVEGSTFAKLAQYKEKIIFYLDLYLKERLNRQYIFVNGQDVNLTGSAIAALTN